MKQCIILLALAALGSLLGCDQSPASQATAKPATVGPEDNVPAHVRKVLNHTDVPLGLSVVYDPENGNTIYIYRPTSGSDSIFVIPPERPVEKPLKK